MASFFCFLSEMMPNQLVLFHSCLVAHSHSFLCLIILILVPFSLLDIGINCEIASFLKQMHLSLTLVTLALGVTSGLHTTKKVSQWMMPKQWGNAAQNCAVSTFVNSVLLDLSLPCERSQLWFPRQQLLYSILVPRLFFLGRNRDKWLFWWT